MLALYHANHSTCSQKVRIGLAEKGLTWEDKRLNLAANEHLEPDYLALNPNGVVPTLVHDNAVIRDSSVILEYLDDVFPEPRLMPEDPVKRAHARAWMRFFEEVPTTAVRVPSFNMAFLTRWTNLDDQAFRETQTNRRPLRKHFFERMSRKGFSDGDVDASLEQLELTLTRMDAALAEQPWLTGASFGIADIVIAPLIDRMDDLGMAGMWEDEKPKLTDWLARVKARKSFEMAFYPGARLSEFLHLEAMKKGLR